MKQLGIIKEILEYTPHFQDNSDLVEAYELVHSPLFAWNNYNIQNYNKAVIMFYRHAVAFNTDQYLIKDLYCSIYQNSIGTNL